MVNDLLDLEKPHAKAQRAPRINFEECLTLYRGLGCRPDDAGLTCRAFVALPGKNVVLNGRLTVNLDEQVLLAQVQPKAVAPAQDELPAAGKEGSDPASAPAQDGVAGAPAAVAEDILVGNQTSAFEARTASCHCERFLRSNLDCRNLGLP